MCCSSEGWVPSTGVSSAADVSGAGDGDGDGGAGVEDLGLLAGPDAGGAAAARRLALGLGLGAFPFLGAGAYRSVDTPSRALPPSTSCLRTNPTTPCSWWLQVRPGPAVSGWKVIAVAQGRHLRKDKH